MIKPDPSLEPEWDEYSINHIAVHGIWPEQVDEVYYSESPFPTLGVQNKKKRGKSTEYRYRLWGTDASYGTFVLSVLKLSSKLPISSLLPRSIPKDSTAYLTGVPILKQMAIATMSLIVIDGIAG